VLSEDEIVERGCAVAWEVEVYVYSGCAMSKWKVESRQSEVGWQKRAGVT